MTVQLFHMLPTMSLPHSGTKHKDGTHITTQIIPSYPFMFWPSGKPCEPINMYFLDLAHQVTGESLKTYATLLSHLVRYCGLQNVCFENLTDANIYELSIELQKEKSKRHPLERTRNDNTVGDILSRAILFLLWYQRTLMLALRTPLIGEQKVSPQITIQRVKNVHRWAKKGEPAYSYTHSAIPSYESREPKRPIALQVIEDIKRCILQQSDLGERSPRYTQRHRNDHTLMLAQLEYLKARRLFLIWIMSRTGLRPSELIAMSVKDHGNILTGKALKIPTMKRRKSKPPVRIFPIRLDAAAVVSRYLTARTTYCEALRSAGKKPATNNAFFLTDEGEPLKNTSLQKDFERLAGLAGYKDVQACLSMFRHRFITYEVTAHLREFIKESGKSRQMMTDIDYESILKRVATKTGHGSIDSLWQYIDMAWDELGVWASTDRALARLHAGEKLFEDLLVLQSDLEALGKHRPSKMLVQRHLHFINRLGEILAAGKQDLEVEELHGKKT